MKQSKYFIPTLRQSPSDAVIESHKLLLRGGYVKQVAAGIYSFLPLGLKVLQTVEQVVREEINATGAAEVFMPILQPAELWEETGRIHTYGDALMTMKDRHERKFALGPTHEEVITDMIRDELNSHKKLPITLYQIQTKFRDELRPRFGLMRGREFMMMDAYSFTATKEDTDEIYNDMLDAYTRIFDRLHLDFRVVSALSGEIGGDESHEFMALTDVGEDTIVYSKDANFAANLEVYPDINEGDALPNGEDGTVSFLKGIEIGHIFKLDTKYSEPMRATFADSDGKDKPILMGCYGLGVSRVIMAIIEQNQKDGHIVWPTNIAPFTTHILVANTKNEEQMEAALKIYEELQDLGIDVLLDERDTRLGAKFGDADLIGSPLRIVVGNGIKEGNVEFTNMIDDVKEDIALTDIVDIVDVLLNK